MDLTFFPGSLPIHEKPPNRSFSNREHAFSLSLPIFEFLNFYKTAGDGGVGRAGISGTPPGRVETGFSLGGGGSIRLSVLVRLIQRQLC